MKGLDFPDFMKRQSNLVPSAQQNTPGIEGYYYTANDDSQMAFWTCSEDRDSEEHIHEYDEYVICASGEYTVIVDNKDFVLHSGDEFFIPKDTKHGGRCKAGTRTIHAFCVTRVKSES